VAVRVPGLPSEMSALLIALLQVLKTADAWDLRACFEQVVAARSGFSQVRLRDRGQARSARAGGEPPTISLAVPWRGGDVVLEVAAAEGRHPTDEGRLQIVRAAVPVATLVLEAERNALIGQPNASMSGGALLRPMPEPMRPACRLTGSGPGVTKLREEIERAARTDFAVLIEGETGAGKEMVAYQIHQWSRRHGGPWIPVNCAALVESLVEAELFGIEDRTATGVRGRRGKIELAHNGTLFLDEVGELSPQVQAKLLRVLQDFTVERVGGHQLRRVNARLIVATNRSLARLVAERTFRSDLFYRVNLLRIHVPPLRERLSDIAELAHAFLVQHRELGISRLSPAALEVMWTYRWPGNVRELFNVLADSVTRAMARAGREITVADLPEPVSQPYRDVLQPSIERGDTMRAWASRYARVMLDRCGNNKTKTCQRLDISYHTLQAHLAYRPRRPIDGLGDPGVAPTSESRES
jgi:transcriptional regulator with GAF, ATPase, and Fis domain